MRGLHLKQRGQHWYYQRRRPNEFADVEARVLISFSLKTTDFSEARLRAAAYSVKLEERWRRAKARGEALNSEVPGERYAAAVEIAQEKGLCCTKFWDSRMASSVISIWDEQTVPTGLQDHKLGLIQ